jgi:hypothetical protein
LTHHNLDKEEKKDVIDQSNIDQGAKELPEEPQSLIELPEQELEQLAGGVEEEEEGQEGGSKKGGKKGKGKKGGSSGEDVETDSGMYKARYNSELAKNRDKIRCGNCSQTMTGEITVVPVEGKKIPKNKEGKYRFRSPGASKDDEMVGVLCETCMTHGKASGTLAANTIKTIVAIGQDGNVQNIRVRDLA